MAQELATHTNRQRQRQDSATTEIVLASTRPVEISTKDNVFLPAMSMEVHPGPPRRHRRVHPSPLFGLESEFTPVVEDINLTGAEHGGEVFCYARHRCRLLREGRVVFRRIQRVTCAGQIDRSV
ncbi:MAG: hypothetical protein ABSH56_22950 [Bryobacteraceae bacterium]|jgi:hypothetical protein